MLRIYIAAPLFSDAEIRYNERLDEFLAELGYKTFLPQRDGYKLSELLANGFSISTSMKQIFERDVEEIRKSDILVVILDGRVPDEGACVEIGYAYGIGKECIGLKTDSRALMSDLDNPLIVGALKNRVARNFDELGEFLSQIKGDNLNESSQSRINAAECSSLE